MLKVSIDDIRVGDLYVKYPNILIGKLTQKALGDFKLHTSGEFAVHKNNPEHQYDFYRVMESFTLDLQE